jgi:hypothetical protein
MAIAGLTINPSIEDVSNTVPMFLIIRPVLPAATEINPAAAEVETL